MPAFFDGKTKGKQPLFGFFVSDTLKSIVRRKKEIWLLSVVSLVTALFLTGLYLFQENSENYLFEVHKEDYGDWCIAEISQDAICSLAEHPYFGKMGTMITGVRSYDTEKNPYSDSLGYLDETMRELGNLILRDGHFPEKDNEIVMTANTLAARGYSIELGQEIVLYALDEERNVIMHKFVLTGILKPTMSLWVTSEVMPTILMTEAALAEFGGYPKIGYFYQLKEEYREIDTDALWENLKESVDKFTKRGRYNSFVYANSAWGSAEFYTMVRVLLTAAAAASLSVLMIAYIQKRKTAYYSLRTIGMMKLKVMQMMWLEGGVACIPAAAVGVLFAALGGRMTAAAAVHFSGQSFYYEDGVIGQAVGIWLAAFLISMLFSMLFLSEKRLYENKQEIRISARKRKGLNRLHPKKKLSGLCLRNRKVHAGKTWINEMIVVLFLLLFLFSAEKIYEAWHQYDETVGEGHDFTATWTPGENERYRQFDKVIRLPDGIPEELRDIIGSYGGTTDYYLRGEVGFSDEFMDTLEQIPQFSYTLSTLDQKHIFDWDDMENGMFFQTAMECELSTYEQTLEGKAYSYTMQWKNYLEGNDTEFGYTGWYVSDTKAVYDTCTEAWGKGCDYDKFCEGEQVFLITSCEDETLKQGDILRIRSKSGEEYIEVEAAVLVTDSRMGPVGAYEWGMALIGSEALGQKIAGLDGETFTYNYITADANFFAEYDITVKQAAKLFSSNTRYLESDNWYEYRLQNWQVFLRSASMYGMFGILLVTFFVMLRSDMIQSEFALQGRRIKLMRQLGLEKGAICRMYAMEGLLESRFLWMVPPLVWFVNAVMKYRETAELLRMPGQETVIKWSTEYARYAWTAANDGYSVKLAGIALVVTVLLQVGIRWMMAVKYTKQVL